MAKLEKHATPARLRDAPDSSRFYDTWHDYVDTELAATTTGSGGGEFYDAHNIDVDIVGVRSLAWMAFPRQVLMESRDDRAAAFAQADDRDAEQAGSVQNEYCEWRVTRSADKITKVTFVTETPEYWKKLWEVDRSSVVALYTSLVSPMVSESDLHNDGEYNPFNRWNTTDGIVHLIQDINNLDAAFDLVQGSADSDPARDNYEMRVPVQMSADSRVLRDVGALVRKGLSVTLLDPIGLYITGWDDTGWTKPDGTSVGNYWRPLRHFTDPVFNARRVMRLEYEVPASEGFVVGDIRIGGRPINYGGQIAEHISVAAVGSAGTRVRGGRIV